MWHCLNLFGLLDPDDESIVSFRNFWSYSPSDSVTSQKNGSEGNYVGVQKERVFFVYPPQPGTNWRETTYKETVGIEIKTGQFFFFASDRFVALRNCLTVTLRTAK